MQYRGWGALTLVHNFALPRQSLKIIEHLKHNSSLYFSATWPMFLMHNLHISRFGGMLQKKKKIKQLVFTHSAIV